jgi:SNF2 family DNA or RNA helicase
MDGIILRKRKTDPDVIGYFPKQFEEFCHVDLDPRHQAFYEDVQDVFRDADPLTEQNLYVVYRQIAGHTCSLLGSQSKVAKAIVSEVGRGGLEALGAAKLDRLVRRLQIKVKRQSGQAVVFTFFGQSILPLIRDRLEDEGFSVAINHGQMTETARDRAQAMFRAGQVEVFLTSDAGSRGINLPEANYVCQYEVPPTYANYVQRMNRIHRIDSVHKEVTCESLITMNTVEEGLADLVIRRNKWSEVLLDDEDAGEEFFTAADRKSLIKISRKHREMPAA